MFNVLLDVVQQFMTAREGNLRYIGNLIENKAKKQTDESTGPESRHDTESVQYRQMPGKEHEKEGPESFILSDDEMQDEEEEYFSSECDSVLNTAVKDEVLRMWMDQSDFIRRYSKHDYFQRRYRKIILDEICCLYESVRLTWKDIAESVSKEFTDTYCGVLEDYRRRFEKVPLQLRQYPENMNVIKSEFSESKCRVIEDLKVRFDKGCYDFNTWFKEHIDRELEELQEVLGEGSEHRVLAGIVKYEVMHLVPVIEQETTLQFANLWKILVSRKNHHFHQLYKEMAGIGDF